MRNQFKGIRERNNQENQNDYFLKECIKLVDNYPVVIEL